MNPFSLQDGNRMNGMEKDVYSSNPKKQHTITTSSKLKVW